MSQNKAQQYINEYDKIHELSTWNLQYPASNLEWPGMQKYQKNTNNNHEKNQSIETDPEMLEIMQLGGKNYKRVIINMLRNLKKNMNIMRSEMETIKRNLMELLELKSTISKMKNLLNGLKSNLMQEKISVDLKI